jgi:flagellar hook-basal body complex protein FliE
MADATTRPAPGFAETLGNLVGEVNQLQHRSDDTFRAFLRGQAELHDVALASHEASIAMRLTAEIRNKLIDAYREIMRTPM